MAHCTILTMGHKNAFMGKVIGVYRFCPTPWCKGGERQWVYGRIRINNDKSIVKLSCAWIWVLECFAKRSTKTWRAIQFTTVLHPTMY